MSAIGEDARLGALVTEAQDVAAAVGALGERRALVLFGFPHHEGVRRNGGRVGAAEAPAAVRPLVRKMGQIVNPETGDDLRNVAVIDGGDIGVGMPLEDAHGALTAAVQGALEAAATHGKTVVVLVIGGGNDQSYPNAAGLLAASRNGKEVGVFNVDAHLDVRELKEGKVHSGSPFRQLCTDPRFDPQHFVEFAAQGSQCAPSHARFVTDSGGSIMWLSQLGDSAAKAFEQRLATMPREAVFLSFDLDAVRAADAPGVSCPGSVGLSASDALQIMAAGGADPRVKLIDISEFNPTIEAGQTGRLVANMVYQAVIGLSRRG